MDDNKQHLSPQEIKIIVNKILQNLSVKGYEKEDLQMEGILAGIKAVNEYDRKYNVKLSTYVYGRVKFHLLYVIRHSGALKRTPKEQINLESTLIFETGDFYGFKLVSSENQEEDYKKQEIRETLESKARRVLTSDEYEVFKLYLEGYNTKEISDLLGIEYKKISNKISYMKRKIRKNKEKH